MIEFEDEDVSLSTVDTWMVPEVIVDQQQSVLPLHAHLSHRASDVVGAIPLIVSTPICPAARPAVVVALASDQVAERELVYRLESSTPRAPSQSVGRWSEQQVLPWRVDRGVAAIRPGSDRVRRDRHSRELRPTELRCGPATMAVRASHVALFDLLKEARPCE